MFIFDSKYILISLNQLEDELEHEIKNNDDIMILKRKKWINFLLMKLYKEILRV